MATSGSRKFHVLTIAALVAIGAWLRFRQLDSQILIADEWHGLFAAAQFSYAELAWLSTIGATSPPMNLYHRVLLETSGWSEIGIRLPSLAAGVGFLLAAPWLLWGLVPRRTIILLTALVATSPILVYFSRYARPYSLAVLLATIAIVSAVRMARNERWVHSIAFALAAVLVGYLHVLEVRIGLMCLLALWVARIPAARSRLCSPATQHTRPRGLALATWIVLPALGVIVAASLVGGTSGLAAVVQRAPIQASSLIQTASLLFGTGAALWLVPLVAISAYGALQLAGDDRLTSWVLGVVFLGSTTLVLVARPDGAHRPEILARYMLPVLPIALLALARGIDAIIDRLQSGAGASVFGERGADMAAMTVPIVLLAVGPIPHDMMTVNQFTNHKLFHSSYDVDRSVAARFARYVGWTHEGHPVSGAAPGFYHQLADEGDVESVIEYPMRIGDKWIPYPIYQSIHRKRVFGGYRGLRADGEKLPRRGFIAANESLDSVSATLGPGSLQAFKNIVDIDDAEAVTRSGASYLIVHTHLEAELGMQSADGPEPSTVRGYAERYGAPVYSDERISVFGLRSEIKDAGAQEVRGSASRGRPNIILAIADDEDFEHLGFIGRSSSVTPTIDQLAREGVVFPTALTQSRCRPTLAGLLTGLPPHRSGIYFNFPPAARAQERLLKNDVALLPTLLRDAGYLTFAQGKFWEGDVREFGFDHGPGTDAAFVREGQAELFSFIESVGDRPFFVWWAPALPHRPHTPLKRHLAQVDRTAIEPPSWIHSRDREAYIESEATSLAMSAWFDEGLSELRAKLHEQGLTRDTLIVFLIDNGWANGAVSKGSPMEKGIRTPLVFYWPGQIEAGIRIPEIASSLDLMPTLLDFAGIESPNQGMGRSLRPLIELREAPSREALMGAIYPAVWDGRSSPRDTAVAIYIRTRTAKYIYWLKDIREADNENRFRIKHFFQPFPARKEGDEELYDLVNDSDERVNLADSPTHQDLRSRLNGQLMAWWRDEFGSAFTQERQSRRFVRTRTPPGSAVDSNAHSGT